MIRKEQTDLESEQLHLSVKKTRLECEYLQLNINRVRQHSSPTLSFWRHPNGEDWICITGYDYDHGDDFTKRPFGEGITPAEAEVDFHRNWVGQ